MLSNLQSTTEISHGIRRKEFGVQVKGQNVPCVLWLPPEIPKALIALGHGGSSHKKSELLSKRAIHFARTFAWASLAVDAPHHGERISREEALKERAKTEARIRGEPTAPALSVEEKIRFLDSLAAQAVPEWQAALDAVFDANLVPKAIPLAYWGLSQGSSIGVPLLAVDRRFSCAVLGLIHLHPEHKELKKVAQHLTLPLRFVFQWDDPIRTREYGLALFDAFGSSDKSMHIYPGGHLDTPLSEVASWDGFFKRYLS